MFTPGYKVIHVNPISGGESGIAIDQLRPNAPGTYYACREKATWSLAGTVLTLVIGVGMAIYSQRHPHTDDDSEASLDG